MESQLAYDNGIVTSSHLYPTCGNFLCEVAKKDYKRGLFRSDIKCLDMDQCETLSAINDSRNKKHTVDAVIGVKRFYRNRFSTPQFLLIELRVKYQSPNNLSKFELENKIINTLSLLSTDEQIFEQKFFIFNDNVIQQMINWFKNKSQEGGLICNCHPLSVTEFNNLVKSENEFPYEPYTDINEMRKSLEACLNPWNADTFFKRVEYWGNKAMSLSYNHNEFTCIMTELINVWNAFKQKNLDLSEEEELTAEILAEDYFNQSLTQIPPPM